VSCPGCLRPVLRFSRSFPSPTIRSRSSYPVFYSAFPDFLLHFAHTEICRKPPKAFFFEGVVPRDDMHEAFRMTSGAQKRRHGRYSHGLESPCVHGANRCVCAPERRTSSRVKKIRAKKQERSSRKLGSHSKRRSSRTHNRMRSWPPAWDRSAGHFGEHGAPARVQG